ncbi:hypothetical protein SEA_GUDMIT_1 [Gordonia phage Gudmit]|nr:hypothetical protein SEA_GUDMIT_1 [Gordonia phage Gudmit]
MTDTTEALDRLSPSHRDEIRNQLSSQNYTLDDVHTVKVFGPAEAPSVIAVAGRGWREYQAYIEGARTMTRPWTDDDSL